MLITRVFVSRRRSLRCLLKIYEACSQLSSQLTRTRLCFVRPPFFSAQLEDKLLGGNGIIRGVTSHNYFLLLTIGS